MAGRLMLNPWVYGRSGRNPRKPRRSKRNSGRRVPGMLKAPKWRLYRGRRRKHNLRWRTYRGEQLRTGTHRARRHALEAMRSGDPRRAQRYLSLEERLVARRRTLGMNPIARKRRLSLLRGEDRARQLAYRRFLKSDWPGVGKYMRAESMIKARRKGLGGNPATRPHRSNRVIARWRSDLGDRFVDLHQDKGRYRYQWSGEESPQVMSPMLYRDEDAVRAVEAGPVTIMGHFGHRLKRSYRYNRGRGAR